MTEQELIEQLAEKEHESWGRWMAYLFSRCEDHWSPVGYIGKVITPDLVERWQRQIDTPYARLSEQEKQSDRNEVAHILPIIKAYAREDDK